MKKTILLLFLLSSILATSGGLLNAQSPEFYIRSNVGSNSIPFGWTIDTKGQYLFLASEFTGTLHSGMIDTVFINPSSSPSSTTFSDFTIKIGMTTLTGFPSTTFITTLSTGVPAQTKTFTNVTAGTWLAIPLDNPVYYDGTSNLVLEMSQSSYTGGGINVKETSASTFRRIYGNPGPASGVGYDTQLLDFGFDLGASGGNNAGMDEFVTPVGSFCPASKSVSVKISNAGNNNITSLKLHWEVNGVAQTTVSYSGTLVPLGSTGRHSDTVTLGNVTLSSSSATNIKAWTALPNNTQDTLNNNDTILKSFQAANFVVSGTNDTICPSASAILHLSPDSGYQAGDISWQVSTNGTTWTDISNAHSINYTDNNMTGDKWYRVNIGGSGGCYSNAQKIQVLQGISILSTTSNLRCGPGTVDLQATGSPGNAINWYDSQTQGTYLGSGSPFTTPHLNETDTFWAEASNISGNANDSTWIGNSTTYTTGDPNPFYTTFDGNTVQMLVKASELQAAGINPGKIVGIGFDIQAVSTLLNLTNFTVKAGLTSVTDLTTTFETGLTTVYTNPSYTVLPYQINSFEFSTPIVWDGTSNIIIETCFANNDWGGSQSIRYTSNLGFNASHYNYQDNNANHCSNPTGYDYTSTTRPDIQFDMQYGCTSIRQPVIASIDLGPEVDLGNDTTLCPGIAGFTLDAGNPGATYLWIPYATTQTIQASTTGTYKVFVTDNHNCTNSDNIHISAGIQPVDSLPTTRNLCIGDTITLNAANAGSVYHWNTGDTSRTIHVHNPGNFSVSITSIDNCVINSHTQVISRPLPVTHLGQDTVICETDNLILDAGNPGDTYAWNTSASTQTILTTDSGLYYVLITTPYGCQATDSFHLAFWPPPRVDGFNFIPQFYHQLGEVAFSILNQRNVTRVHWDFGDGQGSTSFNPTHNYPINGGAFSVTLTVYNDCDSYSVTLPIEINTETGVVSFKDNQSEIKVYPNPAKDFLNVESQNKERIQQVLVYDGIGRVVGQKQYNKPGEEKIRINTSGLSSGLYLLRIQTNDGWKIKKIDLKR